MWERMGLTIKDFFVNEYVTKANGTHHLTKYNEDGNDDSTYIMAIGRCFFIVCIDGSQIVVKTTLDLDRLRPNQMTLYAHSKKCAEKYAAEIGWDWRLLASQGFSESRFDTTVVSWAGARGIMQIMPSTARAFGLEADRIANPEANIATAVKILKSLNRSLQKYVPDDVERQKFIVAAYNSGIAHVYDAIALAQKYGKNPQLWDGNVAETILMKSKPEFYNDSVCKYGYFRGKQTVIYVAQVMNFYEKSKKEIK
jgi:membrane-bound lytic murein transglycosylase F